MTLVERCPKCGHAWDYHDGVNCNCPNRPDTASAKPRVSHEEYMTSDLAKLAVDRGEADMDDTAFCGFEWDDDLGHRSCELPRGHSGEAHRASIVPTTTKGQLTLMFRYLGGVKCSGE